METDYEIVPCPFCGEKWPEPSRMMVYPAGEDPDSFAPENHVCCTCCCAMGPTGHTMESAVLLWNDWVSEVLKVAKRASAQLERDEQRIHVHKPDRESGYDLRPDGTWGR